MAEIDAWRWLVDQGGGYILAFVIFWFYRKDTKATIVNWKMHTELLLKVLTNNAEILATFAQLVKHMSDTVQFCEYRKERERETSKDARGR